MRIGILTGGSDCPGLNAAIRAVTRRAITAYDDQVLGIRNGWDGLIEGDIEPLSLYSVSGILPKGGTILGTSLHNPFKSEENIAKIIENMQRYEIAALVVIGGEDTLGVAHKLAGKGVKAVGIPKTIDNDVEGTDISFGFDTAVGIATEAIDRLHSTAEAHHRVMVLEVLGRFSGAIATTAGIAGGADYILVPEQPFSVDDVVKAIEARKRRGRNFSIIVVAEGARPVDADREVGVAKRLDEYDHPVYGGAGDYVARKLEQLLVQTEVRVTVLGPLQRGGSPTSYDRLLATRFGVKAADMVHEGKFGRMAALRGTEIVDAPIAEALQKPKTINPQILEIAKVFFA